MNDLNTQFLINSALHTIDIRLLRVFDAIVRSGGFAAAQAALNSSQSTISEQMATLEGKLGITLCQRGRAGFSLTSSGKIVYDATQKLLSAADQFADAIQEIKSAQMSGPFHLGLIDNTLSDTTAPVSRALQKLALDAPGITMSIFIGSPPELQLRVLQGGLHMAIGVFPTRVHGLKYSTLYHEEHGLYCAISHSMCAASANNDVQWQDQLHRAKVVVRRYMRDRELSILGLKEAAADVDNMEAQAMLILSGAYIGFLPLHYVKSQPWGDTLCRLQPNAITLKSEISALVPRQSKQPRLTQHFISTLRMLIQTRSEAG